HTRSDRDWSSDVCSSDLFPRARGDAVRTRTVPLRQATAGCAAENMNANQPKLRSMRPVRSHRARVTCALKENGHGFQHRFDPAFFGSYHESRRYHRTNGSCWSNYFTMMLMSPLRSTRASLI